jgi:hypothetical protein
MKRVHELIKLRKSMRLTDSAGYLDLEYAQQVLAEYEVPSYNVYPIGDDDRREYVKKLVNDTRTWLRNFYNGKNALSVVETVCDNIIARSEGLKHESEVEVHEFGPSPITPEVLRAANMLQDAERLVALAFGISADQFPDLLRGLKK